MLRFFLMCFIVRAEGIMFVMIEHARVLFLWVP